MKTVTFEVGNLLSALSALGVEKQLMTLPGVHKPMATPRVTWLGLCAAGGVRQERTVD